MLRLIKIFLWTIHVFLYVIRDFIFVNINGKIQFLKDSETSSFEIFDYTHTEIDKIIFNFSIQELINLKWALTIFFSLLFFFLSFALLKIILKDFSKAILYTSTFYLGILVFSGLIYFFFGYSSARELMIIPQSPIASIILFTGVKVFKK